MNATDARRAWWLGTFDNADFADSGEAIRYCQVKFKFKGDSWLGDYIYMRAEEMLLTAAEAYCQRATTRRPASISRSSWPNAMRPIPARRNPAMRSTG